MNNYFMETHHHEWILTNKLGSYALGTGNLINQRKYHGLLIASDKNFTRHHLVAGIEEKVEWRGQILHLDSNNYSNCIYPEGFLYLVKPWLRPFPTFLYSALPHQNDILIRKEIKMDADTNAVLVKYTNLGHHKLHFTLHPKFTMAPHHELNPPGSVDHEHFETSFENSEEGCTFLARRAANGLQVCGSMRGAELTPNRYSYYNVFYPWEVMNGYAGIGDQISLFELNFTLGIGESKILLFADQPIAEADKLAARIEKRYAALPKPKDFPRQPDTEDTLIGSLDLNDNLLYSREDYLRLLEFALKDFIANDDIVAGYPYYGAWGRDTMIVLNALMHNPKNLKLAEKVLLSYKRELKDGLIPNMRAESGREANYDTVDATLWYVILLWKLGKYKRDKAFWKDSIKLIEEVLAGILNNYQYPFFVRDDGLIELKEEFAHATWMDVRVDGKPVTPRNGAPVEINALWYNAICCYQAMCDEYRRLAKIRYTPIEQITELKGLIRGSFQKFWINGYLADRLNGDTPVEEMRPNAVIALSLPWEIIGRDQMRQVWERANAELYTPYGLRTLSPKDFRFRKKYYGSQRERDLAYQNGSVWAWLLGSFCGLYMKLNREQLPPEELAEKLGEQISTFRNSFLRGHIASVAEVWDGEHPHFPKGAPAQAISVAALYNIESYIQSISAAPRPEAGTRIRRKPAKRKAQ
ncbi:MAG: glycogen debranching enzyme N-terminal domain-containing protein [Candidatus Cloacimonetes bacterium]|nr:glycogen debranching enzyme N-terminal domain-containing protein [Candidatus Cloacimonadota bacterium]